MGLIGQLGIVSDEREKSSQLSLMMRIEVLDALRQVGSLPELACCPRDTLSARLYMIISAFVDC